MKKNKIKQMEIIDAKDEQFVPSTLDQVWGDDGLWKYNTFDKEEYLNTLQTMNTADLRNHAIKLGILPTANRERLVKQLLLAFGKHVASYRKPKLRDIPKKPSKELIDYLSQAK